MALGYIACMIAGLLAGVLLEHLSSIHKLETAMHQRFAMLEHRIFVAKQNAEKRAAELKKAL